MRKYEDALKDHVWSHIRVGSWVGGISGSSRQVLEGANIPTIHLLMAGSNTCISGFRNPSEARDFRAGASLGEGWHIVDLRSDRPRYTKNTLEAARRDKIEEIFEDIVFSRPVLDVSGWEYDGLDQFSRPVFIENPEGDSIRADVIVTFRPGTPEDWEVGMPDIPEPESSPEP